MRSSVEPSTIPATSSSPWVIGSLSPARNRVGTCGGVAFGVNGWEPIPTTRERREAESAPGALIIWLIIAVIGSAGAGPPSKKACAASASTAPKGSCGESPPRTMRCTGLGGLRGEVPREDRKSTRLNSSHVAISYAVFCLKKKKNNTTRVTQFSSKQEHNNV